jgi:hypothetical protein
MELRHPTGSDIVRLLLLCAPKNVLEELELSEESAEEEAAYIDELRKGEHGDIGKFYVVDILVLALYHAARKVSGEYVIARTRLKGSQVIEIMESIYIAPHVLGRLVELSKIEEFISTEKLMSELAIEKASRRGKSGAIGRWNDYNKYKIAEKEIKEIFSTGKYGNNRNKCAEKEYVNFGVSYEQARKYLRGTPNPIKSEETVRPKRTRKKAPT